MIFLFLFYFITKVPLLHPFHVSVCDMVYNSEDKHLKISVRIFTDDLEVALRQVSGNAKLDIVLPENKKITDSLLHVYLSNHIKLDADKKKRELKYLGYEFEYDAVWAYLEIEKLKPFKEIKVTYTALFEVFDDQENLVHIRNNGKVKSTRLQKEKEEDILIWE